MKSLLRTIILLLVRLYGLAGAQAAKKRAQHTPSPAPRILLVRPDHLGDLLLVTPILDAIKKNAPNAQITLMVGPWSSEVVARHPAINRLITCSFPGFQRAAQKPLAPYILLFSIAQQLRRQQFDPTISWVCLGWWCAALLYLAGIPRCIGYALRPGTQFLTQALPFQATEHASISNLKLASAGLTALGYLPLEEPFTPEHYPLHFIPTPQETAAVVERLQQVGIAAETPVVVIHPGSGAAVKLWRSEAWASSANALSQLLTSLHSVRIILTGSRSERALLEEIAQHIIPSPLLITDATLGELAALQRRALLVLGVDSGPLHLAVSQGTPTVAIFGPTNPQIFGPWGGAERHCVIASRHRCPGCSAIPCNRLDFRPEELEAHPCVRLVTEQQLLATIQDLGQKTNNFSQDRQKSWQIQHKN